MECKKTETKVSVLRFLMPAFTDRGSFAMSTAVLTVYFFCGVSDPNHQYSSGAQTKIVLYVPKATPIDMAKAKV